MVISVGKIIFRPKKSATELVKRFVEAHHGASGEYGQILMIIILILMFRRS